MPKEIKYNPDTPAEELIKALGKAGLGNCSGNPIQLFRQTGAKTVMDMALTSPELARWQRWADWNLSVLGGETATEVRKVLIAKITDPMIAFRLYLKADWLTDEEDRLLGEKFKGKLPTAEKELKDGMVKRQKLGVLDGRN